MIQEDRQLLLEDLCARLPYGVMCQVDNGAAGLNDGKLVEIDISKKLARFDADYYWGDVSIDDIKPYLRPMSSMTEEERSYYEDRWFEGYHCKGGDDMVSEPEIPNYIDWLNAHHFDYRGLIPKGLAIAVTEANNPYKE